LVTIDASVLVAAGFLDDVANRECVRFLRSVLDADRVIHQPTLSLVEVVASVGRRTKDAVIAREAGLRLLQMPRLVIHPLDVEAAAESAAIAGRAMLRGADAIYAATALRHGTTLVTLDQELLSRTATIVECVTPGTWLENLGR
jgi:predicted nucleic acid-binding protein